MTLPFPSFYDPAKVPTVYRVNYASLAQAAGDTVKAGKATPASKDLLKTSLVLIDVQNTFCTPGFELFVGGRSGNGAVEDSQRLCEFIYRNLNEISEITATLDTHKMAQVFHPLFFTNTAGEHPTPYTDIHPEDLLNGKWQFNPSLAGRVGLSADAAQRQMIDYTQKLAAKGKYALTIWPYHAMLGGIGHALVSAVEEAAFYHSALRGAELDLRIKGDNTFTENYSALSPDVIEGVDGSPLGHADDAIFQKLLKCDRMVIAGQAKSHCVAWTISDLLAQIEQHDPSLAQKVYLLEDCTSPVVVPGVVDHTDAADASYARFAAAGMHIVRSTDLIGEWK